ncbi:MAG: DUF305 domain-containing protein [Dermatophilus congolensis]|nr:DUF305 domain-containing protein [Dermatophilus congolensis]
MRPRSVRAAATLLTIGLTIAGCSGGAPQAPATTAPTASPTASSPTADAESAASASGAGATSGTTRRGDEGDIAFARSMIPHHEQAIEMSLLALDDRHGASKQVQDLARHVSDAQKPEIDQMTGWLTAWGVADRETDEPTAAVTTDEPSEAPDDGAVTSSVAASPGAHGDHLGVMSPESMERLAAAEGKEFDHLWLEMMIDHHAGAVRSARDVLQTTANTEVRALAESMVADQTKEIDTMRTLLKGTGH